MNTLVKNDSRMLTKPQWQHLIPHQGAMCLLDCVVEWDESHIHATAISHRALDNPLRSHAMLRSVHLCEYGAQSMAIHGGLLAQRDGKVALPGLLVSLRAIKLHVRRIDHLAGDLDIRAEKLLDGEASWQYAFLIKHAGELLAEGRAAVMHSNSSASIFSLQT
jgi:predicted hotdog family 3-hydroxylacyl-ACP dehydratase